MDKVRLELVRRIGISALVSTGLCFAATAFGQAPAAQPISPFAPRLSGLSLPAPVSAHTPAVPIASVPSSAPSSSIKRVQVLGGKNAVEIEVEGSDRLVPQTRVLTGPDRLVIDFPNASPTAQLRNQSINRGEVKDVRVGLFQSNPPITRVVVDLKSPQSFQIFPDRKSVIIKVTGKNQDAAQGVEDFPAEPVTRPGLVTTNYTAGAARVSSVPELPVPELDVTFRNGMLSIKSTKASLSEILFAVHQRTGADVTLSAGAEQERVAANIGPAPATEVLTRLLNGSKFNYLIVSSATDPHVLDKVILSPKAEGAVTPLPPMVSNDVDDDTPAPPPIPQRAEPLGENSPAVTNAAPTNTPPIPQMNMSLPHATQPPPPQPASTPPPEDNPPD